jgi:hypothetical protein
MHVKTALTDSQIAAENEVNLDLIKYPIQEGPAVGRKVDGQVVGARHLGPNKMEEGPRLGQGRSDARDLNREGVISHPLGRGERCLDVLGGAPVLLEVDGRVIRPRIWLSEIGEDSGRVSASDFGRDVAVRFEDVVDEVKHERQVFGEPLQAARTASLSFSRMRAGSFS